MEDTSSKFIIEKRKNGIAKRSKRSRKSIDLSTRELSITLYLSLKYDDDTIKESIELMEDLDLTDINMMYWEDFIEKDNKEIKRTYNFLKDKIDNEKMNYKLLVTEKEKIEERLEVLDNFDIDEDELQKYMSISKDKLLNNIDYISKNYANDDLTTEEIVNENPDLLKFEREFLEKREKSFKTS